PAHLIEQHDHLGVVRLHPLRQRAVIHAPAANECHARIDWAVRVVVAAGAGAVRTGPSGKDGHAVHVDLKTAVAAAGTRLTRAFVRGFSHVRDRGSGARWRQSNCPAKTAGKSKTPETTGIISRIASIATPPAPAPVRARFCRRPRADACWCC